MSSTMKAVVLDAPGPPEALQIRDVPVPIPDPGEVLIKVAAFGLNRSELHTRLGLAQGVTFPAGARHRGDGGRRGLPGRRVRARPAGRHDDGRDGPARSTAATPSTPACRWRQVIPFHSDLDWATLGAVPEMLQTAYGSLTVGLDARAGQTLLIRGGTSSVGMAAAVLAKRLRADRAVDHPQPGQG